VALDKTRQWADGFLHFMATVHPDVGRRIMEREKLDEETENRLRDSIAEYKRSVSG
jgi:F0F1-type ATP synthase alpha subunit